MRIAFAAIIIMLGLVPPAAAAPLPDFDSAQFCAKASFAGTSQSSVVLDGCVALEANARDALLQAWPQAAEIDRTHCETAAGFAGPGSYAVMLGCLEKLKASVVK